MLACTHAIVCLCLARLTVEVIVRDAHSAKAVLRTEVSADHAPLQLPLVPPAVSSLAATLALRCTAVVTALLWHCGAGGLQTVPECPVVVVPAAHTTPTHRHTDTPTHRHRHRHRACMMGAHGHSPCMYCMSLYRIIVLIEIILLDNYDQIVHNA